MTDISSSLNYSPVLIAGIYCLVGVAWMAGGAVIIPALAVGSQMQAILWMGHGMLFVTLSALGAFLLLYWSRIRVQSVESRLELADQQLQVLHRIFRHNVRNDVNIILGYTTTVADCVPTAAEQMEGYLDKVEQTAEEIVATSEKLRIINSVDPGAIHDQVIDLPATVENEINTLRSRHPDVSITTSLPDQCFVRADDSIAFAIREVLENAIAHCDGPPEACEISLTLEFDDGNAVVQIADNGPGIPAAEVDALETETETPLVHSSSVGLWMVSWLVTVHDGTVSFDTDSETGTTVRLELPASDRRMGEPRASESTTVQNSVTSSAF